MQLPQLIIDGLLLLTTSYIAFFKSYIQEKGKNLATQEDIGRITSIVEEIKTGLNKEIELLKSNLLLYTQNKFSIKSAERDALFALSDAYAGWLYSLIRFSFSPYSVDNIEELDKVPLKFAEKLYELDLAQNHLKLFMHDYQLLELLKELIILTIELESITNSNIFKYKYIYGLHKIENTNTKPEYRSELYKKLQEEIKPLLDNFHEKRINQFRQIHNKEFALTVLIKERIDAINEDYCG
jgi:hypothetical protein